MATTWKDHKRVATFVLVIFVLYFFSEQFFATFSSLLGAVMLGFLLEKKWLPLIFLIVAYLTTVFMGNVQGVVVFFPLCFLLISYLLYGIFKEQEKGTFFFWTTVMLSIFFVGIMVYFEKTEGAVSQILVEAKEEIKGMSTMLKNVMTDKEFNEYMVSTQTILDKFYIFFGLLQVVFLTFLNFAILPYLFQDLPDCFAQPFYRFKIPYYGIWGINIGLIVYIFKNGDVSIYGLNAVLFFLSLYFLQGLSLSAAIFKRFSVPFYVSLIIFVFFLLNQMMWLLISIVGIIDSQFNIKKFLKEA